MKKWSKKVWLSAVALVIAIMSVSAIPASADVSRVVYFTVQNNTICDTSSVYTTFYFNVNNLSSNVSAVSIHLYNDSGTEITTPGVNSLGLTSTFTPGSTISIGANSTVHYVANFGSGSGGNSCEDRPAYGKIVVESGGLLMASGEIRGSASATGVVYQDVPLTVNNGQPF